MIKTNKWKITKEYNGIVIARVQDNIPILEMLVSVEEGDKLLNLEEAEDVAKQIVDDWNFSCDEIEPLIVNYDLLKKTK